MAWPLTGVASAQTSTNVLLILADDVGVDRVSAYAEHPSTPATPNIDRLAHEGLLFRNAWVNPLCSPTRASLLTGRYPFRTGVGQGTHNQAWSLQTEELTLPELLRLGTSGATTSVLLGKWHLAAEDGPLSSPLDHGFDLHFGTHHNVQDYFHWTKVKNGVASDEHVYLTTDTADDAVELLGILPEPWFLMLSFNAGHAPFHTPPFHLHEYDLPPEAVRPWSTPDAPTYADYHKAMVQALDTELGRVLAAFDDDLAARTDVFFIGDNGTMTEAIEAPWPARGKGTVMEGGINVPWIVRGPSVQTPGAETQALVDATDLFATIAELHGIDLNATLPMRIELDSTSFVGVLQDPQHPGERQIAYAETFRPNGHGLSRELDIRAARDATFKLWRHEQTGVEQLFNLATDPFEQTNLLEGVLSVEECAAYDRLRAVVAEIRD